MTCDYYESVSIKYKFIIDSVMHEQKIFLYTNKGYLLEEPGKDCYEIMKETLKNYPKEYIIHKNTKLYEQYETLIRKELKDIEIVEIFQVINRREVI